MRLRILFFTLFFLFLLSFIYLKHHHRVNDNNRFTLVCTTSILADTVRAVGGEHVTVIGLMGPGVDPHLYRAREGDVHRLADADLVLYHGLHLEGKMADMLARMHIFTPTVAVCECIARDQLIESEFAGLYDPHVWHDVVLWMQVVEQICASLCTYDQEHADAYARNAQCYLEELKKLHTHVQKSMNSIPKHQRMLITAHDAFSYFGRRYGLEVVALQGISTESDIGTKDVIDLANRIVAHRVPALFLESSVPPRNIQAVQAAVASRGWSVDLGDELFSDALGDAESGADSYVAMIKHNVHTIVSALRKN